ncbi:MAG TPA: hypothetical protein VM659_19425 [Dongiaceae bacterium]|nr:hypothetical protein [Dongiaceae bacterium]
MRNAIRAKIVLAGIGGLFCMLAGAAAAAQTNYAVGPQYDTTHIYLDPADYDKFMASFQATFGGTL